MGGIQSSITVEWAPAPQHGAPVTRYRVAFSRNEGGPFERFKDTLDTKCVLTGLQSGRRYWFRVQAENQVRDRTV